MLVRPNWAPTTISLIGVRLSFSQMLSLHTTLVNLLGRCMISADRHVCIGESSRVFWQDQRLMGDIVNPLRRMAASILMHTWVGCTTTARLAQRSQLLGDGPRGYQGSFAHARSTTELLEVTYHVMERLLQHYKAE
jgi:hypothetical protein